jgi:hypothetical protein
MMMRRGTCSGAQAPLRARGSGGGVEPQRDHERPGHLRPHQSRQRFCFVAHTLAATSSCLSGVARADAAYLL